MNTVGIDITGIPFQTVGAMNKNALEQFFTNSTFLLKGYREKKLAGETVFIYRLIQVLLQISSPMKDFESQSWHLKLNLETNQH